MERRFEGKVALVTGAATGMGQATATRLAADGATVAVNHLPGQDPGETLARINKANGQGFGFPTDMRDPDQVTAMVHGVAERAGRLDYVVSNAGINPTLTWDKTSVEDFNRLFETNVRGTWVVATEAAKQTIREGHGGAICNPDERADPGRRGGTEVLPGADPAAPRRAAGGDRGRDHLPAVRRCQLCDRCDTARGRWLHRER